jgi:hypothetical protein
LYGRKNVVNALARRALSIGAIVTLIASSGCGGGGTPPPDSTVQATSKPGVCPQVVGGCPTPLPSRVTYEAIVGNYDTSGTLNTLTGSASGSADDTATDQSGTTSGSANWTTGQDTVTISAPWLPVQRTTITYLDANFVKDGTNALPGGGTMVVDSAAGTATATVTDANGTVWTIAGAADPDGVDTDITLSSNGQQSTFTIPDTDFNGAGVSGTGTQSTQRGVHPQSAHGVAAVAGAVAGVAAGVAAVAVWVPGGQTVALVATSVAGLSAAVAGVADLVDWLQTQKKGNTQ